MEIKIRENIVRLDGLNLFKVNEKILNYKIYNNKYIILRLRSNKNNLIAIDFKGNLVWTAKSPATNYETGYKSFYIKEDYLYATATLAASFYEVKINPINGEIIENNISRLASFSTRKLKNGTTLNNIKGCPYCLIEDTISFNWKSYLKEGIKYNLIKINKLRLGWLYKCEICGQPWYLDYKKEMMSIIDPEAIAIIDKWNKKPQILSDKQLEILKNIGATPCQFMSLNYEQLKIPCSIRTTDNKFFECAIISLQKNPPLSKEVLLLNDVIDVQPSEFALPRNVRIASALSFEHKYGYSPTRIKMKNGDFLLLNFTKNFLKVNGYKGRDATLDNQNDNNIPTKLFINNDPEQMKVVIGDWTKNYFKLFIKKEYSYIYKQDLPQVMKLLRQDSK